VSQLQSISADHLANVTGGAAKPLKARRIGKVKVFNNQSLDDMFWEVKPQ
jgi:hypothetical protein